MSAWLTVTIFRQFISVVYRPIQIYNTRWFKYDRDWFVCKQAALVPVIFEPPCTNLCYLLAIIRPTRVLIIIQEIMQCLCNCIISCIIVEPRVGLIMANKQPKPFTSHSWYCCLWLRLLHACIEFFLSWIQVVFLKMHFTVQEFRVAVQASWQRSTEHFSCSQNWSMNRDWSDVSNIFTWLQWRAARSL